MNALMRLLAILNQQASRSMQTHIREGLISEALYTSAHASQVLMIRLVQGP